MTQRITEHTDAHGNQQSAVRDSGKFARKPEADAAPAPLVVQPTAAQCPQHGGDWGDDETCTTCTDRNGDPKPNPDAFPHGFPMDASTSDKVHWALDNQASLIVDLDQGEVEMAGDDLDDAWSNLAPGEPFEIVGAKIDGQAGRISDGGKSGAHRPWRSEVQAMEVGEQREALTGDTLDVTEVDPYEPRERAEALVGFANISGTVKRLDRPNGVSHVYQFDLASPNGKTRETVFYRPGTPIEEITVSNAVAGLVEAAERRELDDYSDYDDNEYDNDIFHDDSEAVDRLKALIGEKDYGRFATPSGFENALKAQ